MIEPFAREDMFTGPAVDDALISKAEERLGYRLPSSYLDILRRMNGGLLRRRLCPTSFPTSWADDHFEVRSLLGIGGDHGIDSSGGHGSRDLISEWEYPDIGIVLFDMPSGGHDAVMLDYRDCGSGDEPAVVYIDEDRVPRRVARDFGEFLGLLGGQESDVESNE
ncbi:1,3-beta-glucan synthase regulator [Amycolatopsis sp. WAC 04169]|uniref:SMI1/KNR4 family protein n=1 Tax=Amycolatopsis sp. WAC 04169 TaxID=2203197 RepID=UPI000F77F78D|nr:SMI1/KNR4 family protein [Amycolatopsis sp. WAC 04169]RSN27092.1 1,3-beta-glucan synthase regulator [Amycolatopsis sp. WAC 04169]